MAKRQWVNEDAFVASLKCVCVLCVWGGAAGVRGQPVFFAPRRANTGQPHAHHTAPHTQHAHRAKLGPGVAVEQVEFSTLDLKQSR